MFIIKSYLNFLILLTITACIQESIAILNDTKEKTNFISIFISFKWLQKLKNKNDLISMTNESIKSRLELNLIQNNNSKIDRKLFNEVYKLILSEKRKLILKQNKEFKSKNMLYKSRF